MSTEAYTYAYHALVYVMLRYIYLFAYDTTTIHIKAEYIVTIAHTRRHN